MKKLFIMLISGAMIPLFGFAHEGHGSTDGYTITHYFVEPEHVCTIMGMDEYYPIAEKYNVPIVVTGFEPVDLLQGILMAIRQLENGECKVQNQYARTVLSEGNALAKETIQKVFDVNDRTWRGIGPIPHSGYEVNERYKKYNARLKFKIDIGEAIENKECISGDIMLRHAK